MSSLSSSPSWLTRTPSDSQSWAREALVAGLLALLLMVIGNYQQAVIGFDSRFVLFAQEMLRHGPGFFPTTYGEPYPDYSSLSTLFIYLLSLPLGRVISLTAWLPTALASAVTVGLMYRLVAPHSRQWALASIALLLLSNTFITEARAVSLDQMLAAVAFAVFYLGYAADHYGSPRRFGLLVALLVLGFAIRGPIGLVVPTGMLCSYYLLNRQWRRLFGFGSLALLILALSIAVLLLLAYRSGGMPFVHEVVRMQVTGRLDGSEGTSGVLYYFGSSLGNYALAYPMALLVLLVLALTRREHQGPALQLVGLCLAAGLIVMVGLSVPQAKKARYLLSMAPMAAIIAGYPFQAQGGRWLAGLRGFIQGLWLVTPGLLMLGLLIGSHKYPDQLSGFSGVVVMLGVLQVAALLLVFKPRWSMPSLAGCAVLALWATYIGVVEPVERDLYDTRTFSLAIQQQQLHEPAPLMLYAMGKDAKAIKFMVNLNADLQPLFSDAPEALTALKTPTYVMMQNTVFEHLHKTLLSNVTPLLTGHFDKDDYVLLRLP